MGGSGTTLEGGFGVGILDLFFIVTKPSVCVSAAGRPMSRWTEQAVKYDPSLAL